MSSHAVAEASWGSGDAHVQSTATRHPRPQADGARGASHLPLRFSAKPSPGAPWAGGLLSVFWDRGSSAAQLHQLKLKTLARGRASWGGWQEASSRATSSGRLARRWRDQGRVPREVPMMQSMTIETRWASACVVSLFPLRCKGGKHRPRHQAKVTVSVQQDQDQRNGRMEVTMEPRTASLLESLAVEDQL